MYQEIQALLSKFGIEQNGLDSHNIRLLKLIVNYKKGVLHLDKKLKRKLKQKLILIADDNVNVNNFLKELLSDYFRVEQVFAGNEVCDKVQTSKPFILILDNNLPISTG